MANKSVNPQFIGRSTDDDNFKDFFFDLPKDKQIEFIKYLESKSTKGGMMVGIVAIIVVILIVLQFMKGS